MKSEKTLKLLVTKKLTDSNLNVSEASFDTQIHIFSFFIFTILLLCLHCFINPIGNDDVYFSSVLSDSSLFEFLKARWQTWSSRTLIEAILVHIYIGHGGLWRVVNSLCYIVVAEGIISLTLSPNKKRFAPIVYFLLFLIPRYYLNSAGWGATTVNYLWPLAAAMPCAVIIKKIFSGETVSKLFVVISLFFVLFAANQEQLAALIFGLSLVFLCYRLFENKCLKKQDFYFIILMLIALSELIYMLSCPGNHIRYEKEIQTWFPEYSNLHFTEKIQIGILQILSHYFTSLSNILIFPLLAVLTVIHHKRRAKFFIFQVIFDGIIVLIRFSRGIGKLLGKETLFGNTKLAQFCDYSVLAILFECTVFVVFWLFVLFSVYKVSYTKNEALLNLLLLCSGFCSAFILAFSPTIYASGARCYLFFTTMIFIVTMQLFQNIARAEEMRLISC